jgi:hypothetical protein
MLVTHIMVDAAGEVGRLLYERESVRVVGKP